MKNVFVFFFATILFGCIPKMQQPPQPIVNADSIKHQDSLYASVQIAHLDSEINMLLPKFVPDKDDFNNTLNYYHKTWGTSWPNRKCLTAVIDGVSGKIWLKSNFCGSDWIFHKQVRVLLGSVEFKSPKLDEFSDNSKTQIAGGKIWEVNIYDTDGGIIRAIRYDTDEEIKVRFEGREYYDDIVMTSKDKQAFYDSYELSTLLAKKYDLTKRK